MSYCFNPDCQKPNNPADTSVCHTCRSKLLLKDRYRAIKPIGQGGFGRTYLAVDEDRLATRCVIKQLLPQVNRSEASKQAALEKARQLFNQEALRLCELGAHPQIPNLQASFEQDTRLYLVQEYIHGKNLLYELKHKGAFSEQQILEVLHQLLSVLKFIHSRHVIHRDITPVNILRREEDGKLVLIDFGIAKQVTFASVAKTGTRIGTEGYAPLEQMRSGKAYPASDIYSLGVTSLSLLTRARPDQMFDPLKGWIWRELLAFKGIRVSVSLGKILDKMIQERVSDRYQTADEVLFDLAANGGVFPLDAKAAIVKAGSALNPLPDRPTSNAIQPPASTSNQPVALLPVSNLAPAGSLKLASPLASAASWKCVNTLTGHSSWVTCVAISPDGHTLATASLDDKILVWNLHAGTLRNTLNGHIKAVNSLAISPDGQTLASGSDDGTIKLWQLGTGTLVASLNEHLRDVNSVAFSPDGLYLASGSEDRTIKLWQLTDGEPTRKFPFLRHTLGGPSGMIKSVAISPDGKTLVSGGLDNHIYIWDLAKNSLLRTLKGHFNSVNSIAIGPDGQTLASGSKDATIKLWHISTAQEICSLRGHANMVNSVAISPDGKTLVSGSSDKTIMLWELPTGKLIDSLSGHAGGVNAVAIGADSKTIVSGSWDKTIKLWRWLP